MLSRLIARQEGCRQDHGGSGFGATDMIGIGHGQGHQKKRDTAKFENNLKVINEKKTEGKAGYGEDGANRNMN